jgi:hypothetical protein
MSSLKEVLPKFGLVFSDRGNLAEIMSKPKLIPIKVCDPCSSSCCDCLRSYLVNLPCRALVSKSWKSGRRSWQLPPAAVHSWSTRPLCSTSMRHCPHRLVLTFGQPISRQIHVAIQSHLVPMAYSVACSASHEIQIAVILQPSNARQRAASPTPFAACGMRRHFCQCAHQLFPSTQ